MHTLDEDPLRPARPTPPAGPTQARRPAALVVASLLALLGPPGCRRAEAPAAPAAPAGSGATAPPAPPAPATAPPATAKRQPQLRTLTATPVKGEGAAALEPAPPVPFEVRVTRRSALFSPGAPTLPARELGPGALLTVTTAAGAKVVWSGRTGILAPVLAATGQPALAFAADLEPVGDVVTAAAAGQALMHGIDPALRPGCAQRTERIQLPAPTGGYAQRYLLYADATDEPCSGMMALVAGTQAREILAWTRRPAPITEVQVHAPPGEAPIFELRELARGAADRSGTRLVLLSGGKPQLRELLAVDSDVVERGPGGAPARRLEAAIDVAPAERGATLTVHTARTELAADGVTVARRSELDEVYRYLDGRVTLAPK